MVKEFKKENHICDNGSVRIITNSLHRLSLRKPSNDSAKISNPEQHSQVKAEEGIGFKESEATCKGSSASAVDNEWETVGEKCLST
ncbi:hypothetical protein QR680_000705 [Steinernema hermaphroditum]|uniref:Uncharacterized protein n=1 Tax=Steinernema hermaphroditum TaxID=289476 RepID=A0AA39GVK9_9BILA|nr:hypothetical protein QR680_000705 [Steinernema hermaphroditum]